MWKCSAILPVLQRDGGGGGGGVCVCVCVGGTGNRWGQKSAYPLKRPPMVETSLLVPDMLMYISGY